MALFSSPLMFDRNGITTRHASALVIVGEEHTLRRLAQELSTISSCGEYLEVTLYQYPTGPRIIALSLEYEHLVEMGKELVQQRIREGYQVELANTSSPIPIERISYKHDPQRLQAGALDEKLF